MRTRTRKCRMFYLTGTLLLALATLQACRTFDTSATKDIEESFYPTDEACGSGVSSYSFGMGAEGLIVTPEDVDLRGEFGLVPVSTDGWDRIVIAFCETSDGRVRLSYLFQQVPRAGGWIVSDDRMTPEDDSHIDGFTKAVFEEDLSGIDIIFKTHADPVRSFRLKGQTTRSGRERCQGGVPSGESPKNYCEQFLTLSPFDGSQPSMDPGLAIDRRRIEDGGGTVVYYGKFLEFNPFVSRWTKRNKKFAGEGIELELEYEFSGRPGLYVTYRFSRVTLRDANIAPPIDKTWRGTDIDQVFKVNLTHHGLNDSFTLFGAGPGTYHIGQSERGTMLTADYTDNGMQDRSFGVPCEAGELQECGEDIEATDTGPPVFAPIVY